MEFVDVCYYLFPIMICSMNLLNLILACNCDPVKSETAACNSTGYCYCVDSVSIDVTDKTCSR